MLGLKRLFTLILIVGKDILGNDIKGPKQNCCRDANKISTERVSHLRVVHRNERPFTIVTTRRATNRGGNGAGWGGF